MVDMGCNNIPLGPPNIKERPSLHMNCTIVTNNEDKQSPWHPLFECLKNEAFNFAIYPSTSLTIYHKHSSPLSKKLRALP
jgi:hypothetical protein